MERRFFQLLEMSLRSWDGKQNFVNLMLSFRSIHKVPADKLLTKGKIKQLLNETVTEILLNGQPNMKF